MKPASLWSRMLIAGFLVALSLQMVIDTSFMPLICMTWTVPGSSFLLLNNSNNNNNKKRPSLSEGASNICNLLFYLLHDLDITPVITFIPWE